MWADVPERGCGLPLIVQREASSWEMEAALNYGRKDEYLEVNLEPCPFSKIILSSALGPMTSLAMSIWPGLQN